MKDLNLKIKFFSPWHCGSGLSAGADSDSVVLKDSNGLPYVPGRTLKGLLREAVEEYAAFAGLSVDFDRAFGKAADASFGSVPIKGEMFFTDAVLSQRETAAIVANRVEKMLYVNKAATAIGDNGIVKDGSLRTIETVIPCELYASVMHVGEDIAAVMERSLGLVKHIGTGRNRGLGRCQLSIEKGGTE